MKLSASATYRKTTTPPAETLPRGVYRVPNDGREYYVAVQDVLSGEWSKDGKPCPRSIALNYMPSQPPEKRSLPSTLRTRTGDSIGEFFWMDKDWQRFYFNMIDRATDGIFSKEKISFEQALVDTTNLHHYWVYAVHGSLDMFDNHSPYYHGQIVPPENGGTADYIMGINLFKEDGTPNKPLAKKFLDMTGNLFCKVGVDGDSYKMEAINGGTIIYPDDPKKRKLITVPPPNIDAVWGNPLYTHWQVESTVMEVPRSGGLFVQSNFPPRPFGLPIPNIGIDGVILIKKTNVVRVENGSLFSPYYPIPQS